MLDVGYCDNVTVCSLVQLIHQHPSLMELDTDSDRIDLIRQNLLEREFHGNLQVLNGEPFGLDRSADDRSHGPQQNNNERFCCCDDGTSRYSWSWRWKETIPVRPMIHCVDCGLLPVNGRGVCAVCAHSCHAKHRTFLGSYKRFRCRCAFSTVQTHSCNIFAPPTATSSVIEKLI